MTQRVQTQTNPKHQVSQAQDYENTDSPMLGLTRTRPTHDLTHITVKLADCLVTPMFGIPLEDTTCHQDRSEEPRAPPPPPGGATTICHAPRQLITGSSRCRRPKIFVGDRQDHHCTVTSLFLPESILLHRDLHRKMAEILIPPSSSSTTWNRKQREHTSQKSPTKKKEERIKPFQGDLNPQFEVLSEQNMIGVS